MILWTMHIVNVITIKTQNYLKGTWITKSPANINCVIHVVHKRMLGRIVVIHKNLYPQINLYHQVY